MPAPPLSRPLLSTWTALALCALAWPAASGKAQGPSPAAAPHNGESEFALGINKFSVLARDSGPVNYYRTIGAPPQAFIRGVYRPGLATVTLFAELPEELRHGVRMVRWRWRALVLPREGNECAGRGDSAAAVYLTWKRGLRWYSLKFIWSTEAPLGATCGIERNPFVAQDSIVLRSGGPVGGWQDEEVDPQRLFREHFENGDPKAELPDFAGMGILTDGDQTNSASAADYADFFLYK
jgi:hypothetical protein